MTAMIISSDDVRSKIYTLLLRILSRLESFYSIFFVMCLTYRNKFISGIMTISRFCCELECFRRLLVQLVCIVYPKCARGMFKQLYLSTVGNY